MLLLTCEHASNNVPPRCKTLFVGADEVLNSHRGWDPGALSLTKFMHRVLNTPFFQAPATRLLVEPNRSVGHPRLFSDYTRQLSEGEKQSLLDEFYWPHRSRVEKWITKYVRQGEFIVHVSVHSFTPVLDGHVRKADLGLLYDPRRHNEKTLCTIWQRQLHAIRPDLRTRRNYPYLGRADGFTTYLRKRFADQDYAGIELEVNQAWLDQPVGWRKLRASIAESLRETLREAIR